MNFSTLKSTMCVCAYDMYHVHIWINNVQVKRAKKITVFSKALQHKY